jgi:hypothetical protein
LSIAGIGFAFAVSIGRGCWLVARIRCDRGFSRAPTTSLGFIAAFADAGANALKIPLRSSVLGSLRARPQLEITHELSEGAKFMNLSLTSEVQGYIEQKVRTDYFATPKRWWPTRSRGSRTKKRSALTIKRLPHSTEPRRCSHCTVALLSFRRACQILPQFIIIVWNVAKGFWQ